jgi:hypothetical protein
MTAVAGAPPAIVVVIALITCAVIVVRTIARVSLLHTAGISSGDRTSRPELGHMMRSGYAVERRCDMIDLCPSTCSRCRARTEKVRQVFAPDRRVVGSGAERESR